MRHGKAKKGDIVTKWNDRPARRIAWRASAAAVAVVLAHATPAWADTAPANVAPDPAPAAAPDADGGIDSAADITVTARKRTEKSWLCPSSL